jgi:hypothetical protein
VSKANKRVRGSTSVQVVLCAVFLVPLAIGIYLSSGTNRRSIHANQVSRDLASMYAQGVDFSQPANRNIALRLLDSHDGRTVLIFTRIRGVSPADCGPSPGAQCTNNGYPAIVQRIVIGDPDLHPSSLGSPPSVDPATGNVLNWTTDASARVTDSGVSLKPGESAYAAETFIAGPDDHTGVYARTLF